MKVRSDKSTYIKVITLGCSKNRVDSEVLLRQLQANDIRVIHSEDERGEQARIVVINTCGFIKDAKQESINTILEAINARKKGSINHVLVMGCLSQRYKKELENEIPDVDKYFGVNDLESVIKHLHLDYKKDLVSDRLVTTPSHYAYLKISEGCDRRCSFCAIPLIRGKHVSRPLESLVQEAKNLVLQGVKEIIVIAQDITRYGTDLYGRRALPELLEQLSDVKGIEWIRLHYAYPAGFPKKVIRIMKERDNICKYLDIPFQHSSDVVLRLMKRGHNRQQNYDLINYIRTQIPDITLRTTLITGHPGETKKEFDELRRFVTEIQFDRLGVFTYSEEDDTYAAKNYKDTLAERIKKERADMLMELQQNISKKLNDNKIGKIIKVIVDGKEGDFYTARSESDSPEIDNEILIPVSTPHVKIGDFYRVQVTDAAEFDLFATIL